MAEEPTDAEVITAALDSRLLSLHTSMPGVVVSYNPATQCANVQPVIKRAVPLSDGTYEHEELPIVHNVQVEFGGSTGGYAMQFPVLPGDNVWLIFSEAATAKWRTTGQISEPGDLRRHDLSYACAIPARGTVANTLTPLAPSNEARMDCPQPFTFAADATGQLLAQFVALSNKVDEALEAIRSAFNDHTVPTAMGPSGKPVPQILPLETTASTKLKSE